MSTGKKTSGGAGTVLAALVVGIAIAMAVAGMPSRQPPDPFEDDPIREVRLEVDWDPNEEFDPPRERTMRITYAVGDDADDFVAFQEDQPWTYTTTAQAGTFIELAATPDDYGWMECRVFIDNEIPPGGKHEVAGQDADDINGCLIEVLA